MKKNIKKTSRTTKKPTAQKTSLTQTIAKKQFVISDHSTVTTKPQPIKFKPQTDTTIKRTQQLLAIQTLLPLIVFFQAFIATVGSLYFSTFGDLIENLQRGELFPYDSGFTPCLLCWFARILMYPIVFISYVALVKKDKQFSDYVLPLSTLGIFLELYHYALQKFPGLVAPFECSATHPCNAMEVDYFGFLTIPFLCLTAFAVIEIACLLNVYINHRTKTVTA